MTCRESEKPHFRREARLFVTVGPLLPMNGEEGVDPCWIPPIHQRDATKGQGLRRDTVGHCIVDQAEKRLLPGHVREHGEPARAMKSRSGECRN